MLSLKELNASVLENLVLNKNPLENENNNKTDIAEHHEVCRFLVSAIACKDKWVFITWKTKHSCSG